MKLILFIFLSTFSFCNESKVVAEVTEEITPIETKKVKLEKIVPEKPVSKYQTEIEHIKSFSKINGYNQNVAIMIDYSVHSGKNRFFIVDLKNEKVKKKALVCHGSCKGDNDKDFATTFSNTANSYCTTLGMALISERDYSTWGSNFKFWLDGLEDNNKNLRSRVVVLHSWEGVKDEEMYPNGLAMSWGCPTISLKMLDEVDELLKTEKRVLLYSFN